MGDDDLNRRDFLRRFVSDDEAPDGESDRSTDDESGDDHGWKPGWQPKSKSEIEANRREVRDQIGDVDEPDKEPFDAMGFIEGLGEEDDTDDEAPDQKRGTIPVHRPPRALPEPEFLDACTRCGDCIEACPHDAIKLAGPRFRNAEGTPRIDASSQPCEMCEDTPCVTACEPDALVDVMSLSMGDAEIQTHDCLAHQGSFCTTCKERCPMPGAIKVRDGKPTIRAAACTGCGICHYVCPAPTNAVRIFPRGRPDS